VVFSTALWGQEWLEVEPSVENVNVNFLMWDVRRNVEQHPILHEPFIVHFFLTNMAENKVIFGWSLQLTMLTYATWIVISPSMSISRLAPKS
jgi:hypothetical protein